MQPKNLFTLALTVALATLVSTQVAFAKTVKVTMHAVEADVAIDNKGTKMAAFTFDGQIPGKVVRVTEGDTVEFTLINDETNKNSHSMDFHAAVVHVLDEFGEVKPGQTKTFKFEAKYPGVFMYHCGASPMVQHIAKGMYGIIIVDPKEGYSKNFPKPDREYVIIQGQYFPNTDGDKAVNEMLNNQGWTNVLINGRVFHYDPVHDPNAKLALYAKPGELVRMYYVNTGINNVASMHPIAGIWERVYQNGNPRNVIYGMQTYTVGVGEATTFDLVSPKGRDTANAIVDHAMNAALRGAITVLLNVEKADPNMGKGDNIMPLAQ